MRKVLLLSLAIFTITSCSTEVNETVTSQPSVENKTIMAREASNNPYGEDLSGYPVLSVEDYPLTKDEEAGTNEAMGNGTTSRCKITSHVVSSYSGNHYYHANCSGTHWIIAWSPRSGWSEPWQEFPRDTDIWHKTSTARGSVSPEQQEAINIVQAEQKIALETKTDITASRRAVQCHTSYLNTHAGHACVSINGQLFNVSWTDLVTVGGISDMLPEPEYTATPVRSCGC